MKKVQNHSIEGLSKNEIAIKYKALVYKIANQFTICTKNESSNHSIEYSDLISAAYDGLLSAIDRYDGTKGEKKQNFTQYAAYMIRFSVLNCINSNKNKFIKTTASESVTIVHVSQTYNSEDSSNDWNKIYEPTSSIEDSIDFSEDECWDRVYKILEENFKKRDINIFYSLLGLNNEKQIAGYELSKQYNMSAGNITHIKNRVYEFMRSDKRILSLLNYIREVNN